MVKIPYHSLPATPSLSCSVHQPIPIFFIIHITPLQYLHLYIPHLPNDSTLRESCVITCAILIPPCSKTDHCDATSKPPATIPCQCFPHAHTHGLLRLSRTQRAKVTSSQGSPGGELEEQRYQEELRTVLHPLSTTLSRALPPVYRVLNRVQQQCNSSTPVLHSYPPPKCTRKTSLSMG